MKWFHKSFKIVYADEQYIVTSQASLTYGVGETQEEAIADYLSTLADDYAWLVNNKDRLSPRLTKELENITKFFGGRLTEVKRKGEMNGC